MNRPSTILIVLLSIFAYTLAQTISPGCAPCEGFTGVNEVISVSQGLDRSGNPVPIEFSDPENAFGESADFGLTFVDEASYYYLGFGGSITLAFCFPIHDAFTVYSVNPFSCSSNYPPQRATLEVSYDNIIYYPVPGVLDMSQVCRPGTSIRTLSVNISTLLPGFNCFKYVRLTDVSTINNFPLPAYAAAAGFSVTAITSNKVCECQGPPTVAPLPCDPLDAFAASDAVIRTPAQGTRQNGTPIPESESIPANALGAGPGFNFEPTADAVSYYPLGFGGSIVFRLSEPVYDEITIWETIENCDAGFPHATFLVEVANNDAGDNGMWHVVTEPGVVTDNCPTRSTVVNIHNVGSVGFLNCWNYVRITDTSDRNVFSGFPTARGVLITALTTDKTCVCGPTASPTTQTPLPVVVPTSVPPTSGTTPTTASPTVAPTLSACPECCSDACCSAIADPTLTGYENQCSICCPCGTVSVCIRLERMAEDGTPPGDVKCGCLDSVFFS